MSDNGSRINLIIADLDRHFARNMGQKAVYLTTGIGIIQRRGDQYVVYFFDNRYSILELDIRDASRFNKFTRDELLSMLNDQLVEW